ncbi:hypothetical protein KY285_036323 [Solanum tuberosum]|nr:hypothetical protein KY285_036323 [Solanum tuberosum]
MAKSFEPDAALFSKNKNKKKIISSESNNNEKGSNGEKTIGGNFENRKCYRCSKIRHIKKYCRVKLSKANIASENDGNEKLKWEQCFTIEVTERRKDDVVHIQALYNNESYKQEWILDFVDNSTYLVANEEVLKIDIGDTGAVKLNDVFHAPGLKRNLVSVSQITDYGKYILFGPNDVKILDNIKNISTDVVLTGEKKGSLFVMAVGEAYVKKTSQTNSATIWHARLGHLGYQLLRQICSKKLVDGLSTLQNIHKDVVCQSCQFGESHRLPFQRSTNRRSTMFEFVRTDLMGPTKTTSYSCFRYVMVLVDDFSRYTWVKFLKERGEALSKFAKFKTAVEKDFGVKIKCLHSDNGGEYMSDAFFKYCNQNGISRKMTCPNTPQQNGVFERKIAHLVSTSLSWKGWRCMDPETRKVVTSRDVVFDEISSYHSAQKTSNQETILDGDQENFEQLPESNLQETNNEGSSNSDDVERQTKRRSTRDKRQPSCFKDYEVQLNCCSITSCFFTGVLDEPVSYEEAKGHPEWNAAMQEEIDALNKNQKWELVSKPENCELITCKWVYR